VRRSQAVWAASNPPAFQVQELPSGDSAAACLCGGSPARVSYRRSVSRRQMAASIPAASAERPEKSGSKRPRGEAALPRNLLKFAIAIVVHQGMLSKPRLTAAHRGKTGLNPSREILKRGVPTCGDVLAVILGHLALLPVWREGWPLPPVSLVSVTLVRLGIFLQGITAAHDVRAHPIARSCKRLNVGGAQGGNGYGAF
jgi:hypothetical protein